MAPGLASPSDHSFNDSLTNPEVSTVPRQVPLSHLRAGAWPHPAHQSTACCCATYGGWDVAVMGNADFHAVQTGPLVEVPVGKVSLRAKGGPTQHILPQRRLWRNRDLLPVLARKMLKKSASALEG